MSLQVRTQGEVDRPVLRVVQEFLDILRTELNNIPVRRLSIGTREPRVAA